MTEDERIRGILQKMLLKAELTAAEQQELEGWLQDPANREWYKTGVEGGQLFAVARQLREMDQARLDEKMRGRLNPTPQRRPVGKMRVYAAAASVAALLFLAALLYHQIGRNASARSQLAARDIRPATNRARLTLSNGSVVYLDSTRNGRIALQGNVTITKDAGKLAYAVPPEPHVNHTDINVLSVPRGGQFQLRLPDGTQVWLNSETTISYPVAFTGERKVHVEGEAFFDVVKDPTRPFIVETALGVTKVLGTTFNVNAYGQDSAEMITVVTGEVSVATGARSLILHPGDQSFETEGRVLLEHPNLQAITAWRRGFFYFQNSGVQSIMRQLSRFYDISVRFEGQPSKETYDGLMSRDLTLADALLFLKKLNINAVLSDSTVIVSSANGQP